MVFEKRSLSRGLYRGLSHLPVPSLDAIEILACRAQGKGWGAATVEQEVAACLSMVPPSRRDGLVAFDVGANVGSWSAALLAANPTSVVHAFEPSVVAYTQLQRRFDHSGNVRVLNRAVGAYDGRTQMWADAPGSPLGSLTKRRLDHFGINFSHTEQIDMVRLDTYCNEAGVVPMLLKLDVEGHELEVLAGAADIVSRVEVVQFEFGGCNIDTRTYFQDFYYFFVEAGFDLWRLAPRGPVRVPEYREQDESFQTTNYLAVRRA